MKRMGTRSKQFLNIEMRSVVWRHCAFLIEINAAAKLCNCILGFSRAGEVLGKEDDDQIVSTLCVVQDSGIIFYIGKLTGFVGNADALWQGSRNLVGTLLLLQKGIHFFCM